MPFEQANSLRYYTFESLNKFPLTHALLTRQGGVSQEPFAQLNVGSSVGDSPESVSKNIAHIFNTFDRPRTSLFDSRLVHGTRTLLAEEPRPLNLHTPQDADIILTRNPDVSLFMRYADCLPLLFYDPVQHAAGLAHSGWKGTVQRVAARAVREMEKQFASRASDLIVAIGPGICAEHYEVGQDVVLEVENAFGEDAPLFLSGSNASTHFDLLAANLLTLKEAGVGQIESAEICTAANTGDWFSYRAEDGNTGRFAVLLALGDR